MRIVDLKLGIRLGASFAALLLLTAVIAAIGAINILSLRSSNEQVAKVDMRRMELAQDWETDIQMNWLRTEAILKSGDAAYVEKQSKEIAAVSEAAGRRLEQIRGLLDSDRNRQLFEQASQIRDTYRVKRAELVKAKQAGQDVGAAVDAELAPLIQSYTGVIHQLVQSIETQVDHDLHAVSTRASTGLVWMALSGTCALLAGILLGYLATRSVTQPLLQAVHATHAIAAGDLVTPVHSGRRDEVGQLLEALDAMRHRLADIVTTVRTSSETVADATAEISQGNLDLSARTERQASALEETAASMEELDSTVRQNSDSAQAASKLADQANVVALKGGEVVAQVVETMKGINESSQRIADIIGVIDSIAFQTNILALNAAVEAARAGEQGRGFAVVASEVRALAGRSAQAAKEIKHLISASVGRVEQGSMQVDKAGHTMEEVVHAIRRVTDIVREISAASAEQSEGLSQVSEAVMHMDQTTQQNAALVEQMAATASSMKAQAQQLVSAVAVFRLEGADQPALGWASSRQVALPSRYAQTLLPEMAAAA
ncbi:MCP four helix bundle domain-containing protein [Acidovorax sp. DW039]|uniref:methyl-accepting chemotaxis protein n=1 Tax=Acidovorax sp. DW039 TaxID=3095606 RepID=UPI0030898D07|nr:MCP four helix bundle domain-containing protein [Acidovorax sp. DW039]